MKELSDKDKICKAIKSTCLSVMGIGYWLAIRNRVYSDLVRLQPGKVTETGDSGVISNFIAFNPPNNKPRIKTKTGKFIGKKMGLAEHTNYGYMTTNTLEYLASAINLAIYGVDDISYLQGAQITDAYDRDMGGASCMTGEHSKKTRLYENNPWAYKMLLMRLGNCVGRAMLLTLDNKELLLDRIYANNENLKQIMQTYAVEQGWYYRLSTTLERGSIMFNRKEITDYSILKISNLEWTEGEVPYMDTLKFANIDEDNFMTITYERGSICLEYCHGFVLESGLLCDNCGDSICEEDSFDIGNNYICEDCRCEYYTCCERCDDMWHLDYIVYIHDADMDVCEYCANTHYTRCGISDCGHRVRRTTLIPSIDIYVCDDCKEDRFSECVECGDLYWTPEIVDDLCKECYAEQYDEDEVDSNPEIVEPVEPEHEYGLCPHCGVRHIPGQNGHDLYSMSILDMSRI